jgi:hypothetical protein
VTGTLTINLGIAVTGGNSAQTSTVNVMVVDQQADAASDTQVANALGQGVRAAVEAVASGTLAGDTALDPANLAVLVNATTGAAVVVTGDASARNATVIAVCQTFEVSPAVCSPPTSPPTDPGTVPGTPATGTAGTPAVTGGTGVRSVRAAGWTPGGSSSPAGELPRTGSDAIPLARAGAALVLAGLVLVVAAGRRRDAPLPLSPGGRIRL